MRERFRELTAPLAYHDLRIVWGSQVLSELGDWAARVALAILVERRTGSAALTGLVITVSVAPYAVLGPVIGGVADRFPRRTVMVLTDLARAAVFAVLVLPLPIPVVLSLAFVAACFEPPFDAARGALLPSTVPRERYGDAIALTSITSEAMLLVGYVGGGSLSAAVSPEGALLVNAGTFVASALILLRLRVGRARAATDERTPGFQAGLRAVFGEPFVRRFAINYSAAAGCAIVGEALAAPYAREQLMAGVSATDADPVAAVLAGVLAAAVPAGVILATLALPKPANDTSAMRLAGIVALVGSVGAMATFLLDPGMPAAVVPFAFLGVVFASRIPANKVSGLRIPDEVRASAFGVINGLITLALAGGAFLGGLVGDRVGVQLACVLFLIGSAAISLHSAIAPPRDVVDGEALVASHDAAGS